jgi:hypothetical protein
MDNPHHMRQTAKMSLREFGCEPNRPQTRESAKRYTPFLIGTSGQEFVVQDIGLLRNQWHRPSCIGQGFCEAVGHQLRRRGVTTLVSGVDTWRDARRVQGRLDDCIGTRPEYAVASLINRGWSEFHPGEDYDEQGEPSCAKDNLEDEVFAADGHMVESNFAEYVPSDKQIIALLMTALAEGKAVIKCSGVSGSYAGYYAARDSEVVVFGPNDVGLYGAGHCERVLGYHVLPSGEVIFLIQGSWGKGFGGVRLPDGRWQEGCAWISQTALENSWDSYVISL